MCALFFVGYLKLLYHGFAEKVRSVDIGAYTTMIHIMGISCIFICRKKSMSFVKDFKCW